MNLQEEQNFTKTSQRAELESQATHQTVFQTINSDCHQQDQHFTNKEHQESLRSPHFFKYQAFFGQVKESVEQYFQECIKDKISMMQHKLIIINQNAWNNKLISFTKPFIFVAGEQYEGLIINYQIVIATFKLQVKLLNSFELAPQKLVELGKGAYGSIMRIHLEEDKKIVAKRIMFIEETIIFSQKNDDQEWVINPIQREINMVLCEFAIYKICSFFKIGPKILNMYGFDIICFEDCMQFYMQQCQPINNCNKQMVLRMKMCLKLLHKLKIIHKDLKTDNILFSTQYNDYVISDYGISHSIFQQCGFLTKTYKEGTFRYMSQDMKKMDRLNPGYIDLYYNDMCGLQISLKQISLSKAKQAKNQQINHQTQFYKYIKLLKSLIDQDIQQIIISSKELCISEISQKSDLLPRRMRSLGKQKILKILECFYENSTLYQNIYAQINQFMLQQCSTSVFQQKQKIEYMIRIHGLSYSLLQYLQNLTVKPNYVKKLISKLENTIKLQKSNYDIEKLEALGLQVRIQSILHRELLYYQNLGAQYHDKIIELGENLLDKKIIKLESIVYCKQLIIKLKSLTNSTQNLLQLTIYEKLLNLSEQLENSIMLLEDIVQNIMKLKNFPKKFKFYKFLVQIAVFFLKQQDAQYLSKLIISNEQSKKFQFKIQFANSYYLANKFDKALQYYQKILKSDKYKDNSRECGYFYNNIGRCYYQKSDYRTALNYYQKSLMIMQNIYHQNHHYIAILYNNIGICYKFTQQYYKALNFHQKVITIKILTAGQNHYTTALTLNNIGDTYLSLYDYIKSFEYYQKSLKINLQTLGDHHIQTVSTLNNLAVWYIKSNSNSDKAFKIIQKINKIMKKMKNQCNPLTANLYSNMGILYQKQNILDLSLKYHKNSLKIRLKLYGIFHVQIAISLHNIAICLYSKQQYKQAIINCKNALQIFHKVLGSSATPKGGVCKTLALCYRKIKKQNKCINFFFRSVEVKLNFLKQRDINTTTLLDQFAECIQYFGRYYQGIYYFTKALQIMQIQVIVDFLAHFYNILYNITKNIKYKRKSYRCKIKASLISSHDIQLQDRKTDNFLNIKRYVQYLCLSYINFTTPDDNAIKQKQWIPYIFCKNILSEGKLEPKKEEKKSSIFKIIKYCKVIKFTQRNLKKKLPKYNQNNVQAVLKHYKQKLTQLNLNYKKMDSSKSK